MKKKTEIKSQAPAFAAKEDAKKKPGVKIGMQVTCIICLFRRLALARMSPKPSGE